MESVSLPGCLDTTIEEPIRLHVGTPRGPITLGRLSNDEQRLRESRRQSQRERESPALSIGSSVFQSPTHAPRLCNDSTSTTPAVQEEAALRQQDAEELSRVLEWFRATFTRIGKHGRVSLKDFKYAAKECEVSHKENSGWSWYYALLHL